MADWHLCHIGFLINQVKNKITIKETGTLVSFWWNRNVYCSIIIILFAV